MPLVAGVDSSTQSTKVEIRDADSGALISSGIASHPVATPPRSEQDPSAWWTAFDTAWGRALEGVTTSSGAPAVAAIAVAAQQHGMVTLDADGEVIRPAKLWNDTESAPDAAWLTHQLEGGAAAWAAACGSVPVAAFTIAKLSWLHRHEPGAWARLARVCLPHDWLTLQLCGEFVTDRGDASGTGYWSPHDGEYRFDLLSIVDESLDWSAMLPRVGGVNEQVGAWGRVAVAPGTGDNMAAALGLGVGVGDVVVSLGTSGTVYAVSDRPTSDETGAVAGFADATGRYLPLVCTLNATKVLDAVARLLGVDHDGLDDLAASAPAAGSGVTLLPYFDGERTPNRPGATGVLGGLRSDVSREQLARAAFNGVICGLLDGLDALSEMTATSGRILVTGGGARSAIAHQTLADLSGRAVVVPVIDEAGATGACAQAAAALLGRAPDEVRAQWQLGVPQIVEPRHGVDREAIREAYAELRDLTDDD